MKRTATDQASSVSEGLLHALLRTWGLLRQAQDPYFAQFGLSPSQWGILRVLMRAEQEGESGLPLKTVSERLLVQPPSVTGVVDRLERQGLVKRHASGNDLRVRRLGLTARGRERLARVLDGHSERTRKLFGALKPDEQETALRLLTRLEAHLRAMARPSPESDADQPEPAVAGGNHSVGRDS